MVDILRSHNIPSTTSNPTMHEMIDSFRQRLYVLTDRLCRHKKSNPRKVKSKAFKDLPGNQGSSKTRAVARFLMCTRYGWLQVYTWYTFIINNPFSRNPTITYLRFSKCKISAQTWINCWVTQLLSGAGNSSTFNVVYRSSPDSCSLRPVFSRVTHLVTYGSV